MTDKERILQEIERLETPIEYELIEARAFECALELVKKIINSLPAETASSDLEKEIQNYDSYLDESGLTVTLDAIARHFAEWQKQKMEKGAVEGRYMKTIDGECYVESSVFSPDGFVQAGGKVKLIILKNNE